MVSSQVLASALRNMEKLLSKMEELLRDDVLARTVPGLREAESRVRLLMRELNSYVASQDQSIEESEKNDLNSPPERMVYRVGEIEWKTTYHFALTSNSSNLDCGLRLLCTAWILKNGREDHATVESATSLQLRRLITLWIDSGEIPFGLDHVFPDPSAQQRERPQTLWSPEGSSESILGPWTTVGDQPLNLWHAYMLGPGKNSGSRLRTRLSTPLCS